MAITPKQILDTAVGLGRGAVNMGTGLLRRDERAAPPTTPATPVARVHPSGSPSTVGAAKPGASRGPKSATAPKAGKTPAGKAKAPAAKPSRTTRTAASAAKTPARPKAEPAAASRKPGTTDTPS